MGKFRLLVTAALSNRQHSDRRLANMVWDDEPMPAHWRIRSQHATRQSSLTSRIIYLAFMFPFSVFISALILFLFAILALFLAVFIILLYILILIILPAYLTFGFFAVWLLHFLKIVTGIGPEWIKENPSSFIKGKAEGFKEIFEFAFTWRWRDDELNKSEDYFLDPRGPHISYTYKPLYSDE